MNKNLVPESLIDLPSGISVHPCRMIIKDGTLMWKDALISGYIPLTQAHEAHIIKTAQRLEDLHTWVSAGLENWEGFLVMRWYDPTDPEMNQGIKVYFVHRLLTPEQVLEELMPHIAEHESLEHSFGLLCFKRC